MNPENMTRNEKLQMIAALKRAGRHSEAQTFWLTHAPRISKKAYEEAV